MFCVKCGKNASVNNFCEDCFLLANKLFDADNIMIYFCKKCKRYFLKGKNIAIDDAIKQAIKTKHKIKNIEIKKKTVGNKIYATIICSGYINPCKKIKLEEKRIVVNIMKRVCDDCTKLSGNYYEALIQVRGEDAEKIFKKIKWMLRNVLIAGIEKKKYGYDIRFVNKNEAFKIANQMRKRFSVNDSYKLVGDKKGEKIYRNFYAIK